MNIVNDRFVQFTIYLFFVYTFQMMTASMRLRTEFYMCARPRAQSAGGRTPGAAEFASLRPSDRRPARPTPTRLCSPLAHAQRQARHGPDRREPL